MTQSGVVEFKHFFSVTFYKFPKVGGGGGEGGQAHLDPSPLALTGGKSKFDSGLTINDRKGELEVLTTSRSWALSFVQPQVAL